MNFSFFLLFSRKKNFFNSRSEEIIHSPTTQYTDFLLADIHTSNSCTPLSPMTSSPLTGSISPNDYKRKHDDDDDDDDEIEGLLNYLLDSIHHNQTYKHRKI
jgi:hypothetical protein